MLVLTFTDADLEMPLDNEIDTRLKFEGPLSYGLWHI